MGHTRTVPHMGCVACAHYSFSLSLALIFMPLCKDDAMNGDASLPSGAVVTGHATGQGWASGRALRTVQAVLKGASLRGVDRCHSAPIASSRVVAPRQTLLSLHMPCATLSRILLLWTAHPAKGGARHHHLSVRSQLPSALLI